MISSGDKIFLKPAFSKHKKRSSPPRNLYLRDCWLSQVQLNVRLRIECDLNKLLKFWPSGTGVAKAPQGQRNTQNWRISLYYGPASSKRLKLHHHQLWTVCSSLSWKQAACWVFCISGAFHCLTHAHLPIEELLNFIIFFQSICCVYVAPVCSILEQRRGMMRIPRYN